MASSLLSLLLGEDPKHRPCGTPCSAACPRQPLLLLWVGGGSLFACTYSRAQRQEILPAGAYLSHEIRASLGTMTDGVFLLGDLCFPGGAGPRRQAGAALAAARAVCWSAALLGLRFGNRESQVDFRVFFPSSAPVVAISIKVVNFFVGSRESDGKWL